MKFQAVKGMRDFYPDQMRLRTWITETWRRVSIRNGFEEFDTPILEYLDLFTVKSGQEIVEQLFSFTDRGGRDLAIRPEITPSLARMVAAKINALPRPIKWFSIPRLCRAERPQRGRLREFFQWNVDVIGVDDIQADAECIFTLVDFLREVGLQPVDVKVHIGSRPLVLAMLRENGVNKDRMDQALLALDKKPKVPPETFEKMLAELGLSASQIAGIVGFMDAPHDEGLDRLAEYAGADDVRAFQQLRENLEAMGAGEYITFDWHIVRGLAYYTGVVYEALAEGERAVAGGGRYDGLLELLGGPTCPATGFGMGDVVLSLLLEETAKIPETIRQGTLEYFVIDSEDALFPRCLKLVGSLRRLGCAADYAVKRQGIGKQLKEANRRGARRAVIVQEGNLAVKILDTGVQIEMTTDELLKQAVSQSHPNET